jgi:hypothetical protein
VEYLCVSSGIGRSKVETKLTSIQLRYPIIPSELQADPCEEKGKHPLSSFVSKLGWMLAKIISVGDCKMVEKVRSHILNGSPCVCCVSLCDSR